MQARLFTTTLLLLTLGAGVLRAQTVQAVAGSIDIQGSRTKFSGKLRDATMILNVTSRNAGQKTNETLTITREKDGASPNLWQAWTSKEVLPIVIFKVYKPGDPKKYKIITLGDALIAKIVVRRMPGVNAVDTHEVEDISFTFRKISVEYDAGSKSASDDWTASNQ